jgi:hypothetical protein
MSHQEMCRSDGTGVALNQQENTHFSKERGMGIMNLADSFVPKGNTSAVKRVEFVSDRMSYIILRGYWCHIIVLNIHSPAR